MVPTMSERVEILGILLRNHKVHMELINALAQKTHGYTGSDLKLICDEAFLNAPVDSGIVELKHFDEPLERIRPTGIRQYLLELPNVSWDDIGGNKNLKELFEKAIIWPYTRAEVFERLTLEPPTGILLYGPPGCSKTLFARAVACKSRMNFLSVKGPELFSKWVGESERSIRELFRHARQIAPAIIFFDEIDAIAVNRSGRSESAVGDRVLAQLLTELDGLEKKARVMVLAATNRPDRLDSALLRPGRLDQHIYIPLPDKDTRREILTIRLQRMHVEVSMSMDELVKRTEGYSGAEVVALCERAALNAVTDINENIKLEGKHFREALDEIVPCTDQHLLEVYKTFQQRGRN